MKNTGVNVGLLTDVGHLQISATTSGFNPKKLLKACSISLK
jgi:uncharacterized protein (UPF0276 family)